MSAYSLTTLTPCRRSCSLCMQTYAEIVVDYADTVSALSKTTRTRTRLRRHFQKTLKVSHRFYRNIQLKKVLGCVYKLQSLYCSNNLKIRKCPYLKKNLRVCLVNDYADTQFSNFTIEYVCGTVFACSYGVQVESFKQKKLSKISCHCPYTVSHTPRQSAGEKNSVPYSASHLRDAPCPSSLASLPHFSSSLP